MQAASYLQMEPAVWDLGTACHKWTQMAIAVMAMWMAAVCAMAKVSHLMARTNAVWCALACAAAQCLGTPEDTTLAPLKRANMMY